MRTHKISIRPGQRNQVVGTYCIRNILATTTTWIRTLEKATKPSPPT
ncbi:MAG: hypothetical protein IPP25_11925 [Saprospiraceae bacterium]|nr:hypothetical protein [Candidatus Opimibacter skivensis]